MIDDRIVTLRVGEQPTTRDLSIHEAILIEHSAFFRTALDKKWREGRSRQIDLPFDSGDVVAAFVDWAYFSRIASKPVSPPELPMDDGEFLFLAQMYSFGDKVQADAFCDDVMTAMALKTDDIAEDGTRTFPSHSAILTLYNGTPAGSPARRFVVDMYTEFGMEQWVPKETEFNHPEFLTDLVRAFLSEKQATSHKQTNYPRRRKWHKRDQSREFLHFRTPSDRLASVD